MTSKIVVNNIEADAGVSTVFFNSDIGATGGTLNVDGNLNVDGVITYEDVTSVDSVGIITARAGIHVTGGNVGIGTNNPSSTFVVRGDDLTKAIRFQTNTSTQSSMLFQNSTTGYGSNDGLYFGIDQEEDGYLWHFESENLIFGTSNTERLRIDSAGKLCVGINTAFGTENENVNIASGGGGRIALLRNDTSIASGNELGRITWYSNDSTTSTYQQCAVIRALASGTFGDGDKPTDLTFSTTPDNTSTPAERLRITSDGKLSVPDNGKLIFGNGSDFEIYHDGSNSIINDSGTGNLQLQTAGTTRLTSTSTGVNINGNVGVQTTYPTSATLVGAGSSLIGLYMGDGHMLFSDNLSRSGGYYIPNGINALNAGPVTLNSTMTLDGVWVIV